MTSDCVASVNRTGSGTRTCSAVPSCLPSDAGSAAQDQDHAAVIRFVASVRERYDLNGHDIDPGIAEALVRAALGDREPVPTTASAVTAQTLLVLGLLEDEGMPQPELVEFLDAATAAAHRPATPLQSVEESSAIGPASRSGQEDPSQEDPGVGLQFKV